MFALVEFSEENGAIDVVETKQIEGFVVEEAVRYKEVLVKWMNRSKPSKSLKLCNAKLLQIAVNRQALAKAMNKITDSNTLESIEDEPFLLMDDTNCSGMKRMSKFPKWRSDEMVHLDEQCYTKTESKAKKVASELQKRVAHARATDILNLSNSAGTHSNAYAGCEGREPSKEQDSTTVVQQKGKTDVIEHRKKAVPRTPKQTMSSCLRQFKSVDESEESLDNDAFSKHASNDLLKAELAFERKRRIRVEKELENYKESVSLVKQLQHALDAANKLIFDKRAGKTSAIAGTIAETISTLAGKSADKTSTVAGKRAEKTSTIAGRSTEKTSTIAGKSASALNMPLKSIQNIRLHLPEDEDEIALPMLPEISGKENDMVRLKNTSLFLPRNVVAGHSTKNYSRYAADLLLAVFGRQMLQTHVLKGLSTSTKPALDQDKLKQIIEHVKETCNVDASLIRCAFRTKMSNMKEKKLPQKYHRVVGLGSNGDIQF